MALRDSRATELKDFLASYIEERALHHGARVRHETRSEPAGGDVVIYTTIVDPDNPRGYVIRKLHWSEGNGDQSIPIGKAIVDGRPTAAMLQAIDRGICEVARLNRRDDAIRCHGPLAIPPPWAYSVHVLLRDLIAAAEMDPVRTLAPDGDALSNQRPRIERNGRFVRLQGARFEGSSVVQRKDRILCQPLKIRLDDATFELHEGVGKRPELHLHGRDLAETLLGAVRKIPLGHLLRHPAFSDETGAIIVHRVHNDETGPEHERRPKIRIVLDDVRVPLQSAPEGADTSWMI